MSEITLEQFVGMVNTASSLFESRPQIAETLNKINFFPIPDGDTGRNVSPVLLNFRVKEKIASLDEAIGQLRANIVKKARGYSGKYMHSFFSGFLDGIAKAANAGKLRTEDIARGFIEGYEHIVKNSHKDDPVIEEGTIVGVMKDVANTAKKYVGEKKENISEFFSEAYKTAINSVKETPRKLNARVKTNQGSKTLEQVGVVDSGALAFYHWLAGAARYFGVQVDEKLYRDFDAVTLESCAEERYCVDIYVDLKMADKDTVTLGKNSVPLDELESQLYLRFGGLAEVVDAEVSPTIHLHGHYKEDCLKELSSKLGAYGTISVAKVDDMQRQSIDKNRGK